MSEEVTDTGHGTSTEPSRNRQRHGTSTSRVRPHDPEHNALETIVEFLGEHQGRCLVFDLLLDPRDLQSGHIVLQDGRTHVVDVYYKLREILQKQRNTLERGQAFLLQVAYRQHYTGLRVERNERGAFTVYLLDPNRDHPLYPPLPMEVEHFVKELYGLSTIRRARTCIQQTPEDTFCQTWSLLLLADPKRVIPGRKEQQLRILFELYRSVSCSVRFTEWVQTHEGATFRYRGDFRRWGFSRFCQAVGP